MSESTVYTWAIAELERNSKDGIVFTAHYSISAKDDVYSSGAYGSVGLEAPEPDTLIPFDDLTEELMISWVKEKLGGEEKVQEIHLALQQQLDEKHAPTQARGLPWN